MSKGDERPSDWDSLVPQLTHPFKRAILEAVKWLDRPLSAPLIAHMCEEARSVSEVAYHLRKLADSGTLEMVYDRQVRAGFERFYVLSVAEGRDA